MIRRNARYDNRYIGSFWIIVAWHKVSPVQRHAVDIADGIAGDEAAELGVVVAGAEEIDAGFQVLAAAGVSELPVEAGGGAVGEGGGVNAGAAVTGVGVAFLDCAAGVHDGEDAEVLRAVL